VVACYAAYVAGSHLLGINVQLCCSRLSWSPAAACLQALDNFKRMLWHLVLLSLKLLLTTLHVARTSACLQGVRE
jgi:hypothetical protein